MTVDSQEDKQLLIDALESLAGSGRVDDIAPIDRLLAKVKQSSGPQASQPQGRLTMFPEYPD